MNYLMELLLKLVKKRFKCAESLFKPYLMGIGNIGIHEAIEKCIMASDVDLRSTFYNNIMICGGSSLFNGLTARLQNEITALALSCYRPRILQFPNTLTLTERKFLTWIGGSILASLSTFQHFWISKEEYNESGPSIVHRKCW